MVRRSTGQVIERRRKAGTVYALRFYAGQERHYVTLGTGEDGWNRRRAEDELAATMAAVRAGTWEPPRDIEPIAKPRSEPTFHAFASQWLESRSGELRPRTVADYTWALSYHLLPRFKDYWLSQIGVAEVDAYKAQRSSARASSERRRSTRRSRSSR